jgi:chemotaxis protein MotB
MGFLSSFGKKKQEPEILIQRIPPDDAYLQNDHSHDEGNWLISYADLMTLLCGFFIMMLSLSTIDEKKFESVRQSISKEFGGNFKKANEEYAAYIQKILNEHNLQNDVVVRFDPEGVSVLFKSTSFFDSLSAELKEESFKLLTPFVDGITSLQKKENKKFKVIVEGHTDSRAVIGGPFPSNWELSGARASRVVRYFIEKGFEPTSLVAIGYADTKPEAEVREPASEEQHSKNRRVVIRITNAGNVTQQTKKSSQP